MSEERARVSGGPRPPAIVTGASRGIGRAIAERLAADGHPVVVTYHRRAEAAEAVVGGILDGGGRALACRYELGERESGRTLLARATAAFGAPLVLINNAAVADERPFEQLTDADWDRVLGANLRGPFALAQDAVPAMVAAGWGRVVNVTSIGGQWGGMRQVHYAAAKAGLINLTQSLARLFSKDGVTSNAVAPGLVPTEMTAAELDSDAGHEKARGIPAGRLGTTADIAGAVAWLVSDDAAYVTGQTINLNGGMLFG